MRHPPTVSSRVHLPVYSGWLNRYCPCQFLSRHRPSRHLLRRSPLPLRSFDRSSICNCCCLRTLIPIIYRVHPAQYMNQSPLWCHVRRGKPHLFPTTLPWPSWHASSILRLPRRLHPMKHSVLNRISCIPCSSHYVPVYYLRSLRS